ncbi:MAG TPA: hypothetical protein ENN38_03645 [Actinobacteria bacterium]|nr:hypothetical protein [Actinomycetota bacterium]
MNELKSIEQRIEGSDSSMKRPNKALHLTAFPLRSIAAGELGRYRKINNKIMPKWYGSSLNPDGIIPPAQQWKIQWARVQRWFTRLAKLEKKYEFNELSNEDIDDIITFFQNCYHLRDWIEDSKPELKQDIVIFFNTFEMKICREICLGFKHKNLQTAKIDKDFGILREYDHFTAETNSLKNPVITKIAFEDGNNIKEYCPFTLAKTCYQLWEEFIKNKNL